MRSARRLGCAVLLAALAASCDTTAPLQLEAQTVQLRIVAPGAQAQQVDVWNAFEDNDGDFQPDGATFLYCVGVVDSAGAPQRITPLSVPWPFSVRVTVVRAEQDEREEVTSPNAPNPAFNKAQYDTTEINGVTAFRPPVTVDDGGTMRTFRFSSGRRLTTMNRDVVRNVGALNLLCGIQGVTCGFLSGICSNGNPGNAEIDGSPQPFTLELGKGDTVRVEARRSLSGPSGGLSSLITRQPTLGGALFLDGKRVNVEGTSSSGTGSGDGFAFWFTSR